MVVSSVGEQYGLPQRSVVAGLRGLTSVQWRSQELNRFVGAFRLKLPRSSVGSRQENRPCGQKFVAGDTAFHLTWPAMCTRNRGSRCDQHCRVEVINFPNCTTKFRVTDTRLDQCREQRLISLVPCDGSRADLK